MVPEEARKGSSSGYHQSHLMLSHATKVHLSEKNDRAGEQHEEEHPHMRGKQAVMRKGSAEQRKEGTHGESQR